jgi:hypothetical protein
MIFSALRTGLVLFAFTGLIFGLIIPHDEADAAKASKTKVWKYGEKTKGIVCGDKLCSEKYKSR